MSGEAVRARTQLRLKLRNIDTSVEPSRMNKEQIQAGTYDRSMELKGTALT